MNYSDFCIKCQNNPPAVKPQWVDSFNAMILHTRKNEKSLKKLIDITRPSEPEELKKYRLENIEYITHGSMNDAKQRAKKILQSSNYTYEVSDDLTEKLKEPIYEFDALGTPDHSKFQEIIFNRFFDLMADTGNGAIVWLPVSPGNKSIPPNQIEQSRSLEFGYSLIEPENIFYISNYSILWRLRKKVEIPKVDTTSSEYVFFYADNRRYIKLMPKYVRKGDSLVLEYDEILWYSMVSEDDNTNEIKYPPFVLTKGNAIYDQNGNLYYESYFGGFVPWGNLAYKAFTDYDAVRTLNSFPIREEKEEKCDTCNGSGKVVKKNNEGKTTSSTCGTCSGSGFVSAKSPFSVHKIKKPSRVDGEEQSNWHNVPAVRWLTPPVDILDHSAKTWKEFLQEGEKQINIKFLDEAQSGLAKNIDREGLTDLLMAIANNIGNVMEKSFTVLEAFTHPSVSSRKEVSLVMPKSDDLQMKSGGQLMSELKELDDAPLFMRNMKIIEVMDKIYPDNHEKMKFTKVLMYYDPLFGKTDKEIKNLSPISYYRNKIIMHTLAPHKLQMILISEPRKFNDMSVEELSQEIATAIEPELQTQMQGIEDPFPNEL